mmetsp:Transcript_8878/g.29265  ORF Transcript_8878/g.29265 Transcript_8878/m.29265 type:complete len:137 (-) Transcript_8878:307-717(-)
MTERAAEDARFTGLWRRFMDSGDDKWRGLRLKMIPCVVEGNFFVKKLLGDRPVLIKAIKTRYHTGPGYIEVVGDILSSKMATNMWRGVESFAKSLVVDLGFVLEAQAEQELPERLMGTVRFHRINLRKAVPPPPTP